jgi:CCR4-NOT transcription complex subunit 6
MEKFLSRFSKEYLSYLLKKPAINFKSSTSIMSKKPQLSVMTWNTLASGYTTPSTYYYVKPDYLDETHRMNMILYDIVRSNCDVVCLQEIEKRNFDNFFVSQLEDYEGRI